jgi:FAD/FMN-containing dehydrogenase
MRCIGETLPAGRRTTIAVVNFARETGAPLAVRCGMHNPAGFSVVDDG